MKKEDFYLLIDEVCELDAGTIKGNESIQDSGLFDSLSKLGLISLADKYYNYVLEVSTINDLKTVDDFYKFLEKE